MKKEHEQFEILSKHYLNFINSLVEDEIDGELIVAFLVFTSGENSGFYMCDVEYTIGIFKRSMEKGRNKRLEMIQKKIKDNKK